MTAIFNGTFENIFFSILSILIMVVIGFIASKRNIITSDASSALTTIIFNITIPCLIFSGMLKTYSRDMILGTVYLPLAAFVDLLLISLPLALLVSWLLKLPKNRRNLFLFMVTFSNYAFLPIPLANMLLGQIGVVYVFLFGFAGDLVIWTIGIRMFNDQKGFNLKKILNPGLISIILAFIFVVFAAKVPEVILKPMNLIGTATIPLAMLITGSVLAGIKLKEARRMVFDRGIIALALIKLVITPVIFFFLTTLFPIDSVVRYVILMEAAMPCAFTAINILEQYNKDSNYAATGVLVTTLCSLITIPMVLYFVK